MPFDLSVFLVASSGVLLIAFMKGAFGGGFAIIGIPLLSLVLDPLQAGVLLVPLFLVMDLFAFRYWRPGTWSVPDVWRLIPASLVGIGVGYFLLLGIDARWVKIVMALITLLFLAQWMAGGGKITTQPRSTAKGVVCGFVAGVTSMIAHSGGPPLAMYLLPLGLAKTMYASTTSLFFTVGNVVKIGPWIGLAAPTRETWILMAMMVPVCPLGVMAGWALHQRLDQTRMMRWCYGLLAVTAAKLLWDGVRGLL